MQLVWHFLYVDLVLHGQIPIHLVIFCEYYHFLFTSVPDVAPPNFVCEAISDSEVMATWGDIPLSQRNGQVQYVLSLTSVDQEENIHRTTLQAPTTPIVIGGLRSNTTYFCVLGVVTNRVGPHSHPQEIVTFLPGGRLCNVINCQIPIPKKCNSLPYSSHVHNLNHSFKLLLTANYRIYLSMVYTGIASH